MRCKYSRCDKLAVAYSVLRIPLCIEHAELYGSYTFMPEYADFFEQLKERGLEKLLEAFNDIPNC